MSDRLRIATRGSRLALWQAEWVQRGILSRFPEVEVELVVLTTQGDRILDRPLAQIGGKGLFIKELEDALLEDRADLAVHSMKDVMAFLPEGLEISVITERDHPGDAWVSPQHESLEALPRGAVVGTSSLRRAAQLKHLRPDLEIRTLRGNVETRLRKVESGEYDAAVLAMAGLRRLGLEAHIRCALPREWMLPAIAQGAVGIETRTGDEDTLRWLRHLDHPETRDALTAEREVLAQLEGNCQVPLAGFAEVQGAEMHLEARLGSPDGATLLRAEGTAPRESAQALGQQVARQLLQQGGQRLLQDFASTH
jgi:hydroxymethylbilane synthase